MSKLRGAAVALLLSGCTHATPAPPERRGMPAPHVTLAPEGAPATTVEVEIARTQPEQARGLMYRDHLERGRGMLFLFDKPHHLEFWMRNTYIPLDMIFIDADRKVLGVVEKAQPLTDDPRAIEGISQFVLEVPGGFATAHRIAPGTPVRFVDVEPAN